jgi:hypothetical protein
VAGKHRLVDFSAFHDDTFPRRLVPLYRWSVARFRGLPGSECPLKNALSARNRFDFPELFRPASAVKSPRSSTFPLRIDRNLPLQSSK